MNSQTPASPTTNANSVPSSQGGATPSNDNPFQSAPPVEPTSPEPQQQTQTQEVQQPANIQTPAAAVTAPAQPAFDPQTLTKTIVDSVLAAQNASRTQQPVQPQQVQPMAPEEFRKHYGIPAIDAQTYESIIGVAPSNPKQVEALDGLFQNFMRAGLKMGQDLYTAQLAQVEQRFSTQLSPIQTFYAEQQERRIVDGFVGANPDLKDEMATVNEVKDAMIARGVKFSSPEEMYKQVADATRQLLTRIRGTAPAGGNQSGGSATSPQGRSQPSTRTMTPASAGGRGGSASAPKPASTAELVFGS